MSYYSDKLAGKRLRRCYEIASPRVKRYLQAEIAHVRTFLSPGDQVLELGCGYGRVLFELADVAGQLVGIDTADENLSLARELAGRDPRFEFINMDAAALTFEDDLFDVVICVQNGIRAFGVEPAALLREASRVCRPGGELLFSSYAEGFWPHRLEWFEAQADEGLLGEIDRDATGDGVIACRDGFRSGLMTPREFESLWRASGLSPRIAEIDGSSTFCTSRLPGESEAPEDSKSRKEQT